MKRSVFVSLASSVVLFMCGIGCTSEPEAPTESITEGAFAVGGVVPWTLSNGQLRLCFTQDGSLTSTELTNLSNRALTTLNGSWGNVPGLRFVSGCTAPAMGIKFVRSVGDVFGHCGLGNGASCTINGDPTNLPSNDQTIVHEVGHGLGLLHEHQRPDAPPLCSREQTILNGCTSCATGTCAASDANSCWFNVPAATTIALSAADKSAAASLLAGGRTACSACAQGSCVVGSCSTSGCTASSYWACLGTNPSSGTIAVDANDKGSALGRVCDRLPEGSNPSCGQRSGIVMTGYDPLSIMNYCSDVAGRSSSDAMPTPHDLLGVEMLYSKSRTYVLGCNIGCFLTSSGVVTSSAGAIESEWIMRGSVGIPFRVSGTSTDLYSYSVAGLGSGTSTLTYSFHDVVGNSRTGSGSVNKSGGLYAALATVVTAVR